MQLSTNLNGRKKKKQIPSIQPNKQTSEASNYMKFNLKSQNCKKKLTMF